MKHVGRPLPRLEDPPLLTGGARFVADVELPHALHMRLVRAAIPFGRIERIDTAAALAVPGVAAVWTADDIAMLPPLPIGFGGSDALDPYRQPVLARDVVRHVGEPVAAVFADTAAAAEDAAELVGVDVTPFTPVLDAAGRLPLLTDDLRSPQAATVRKAYGEIHPAFDRAHRVVETRIALARDGAMPLETRGAAARWDPALGRIDLWGPGRPHAARDALVEMLDLPRAGLVVHGVHLGGDGGPRGVISPEDVLVCHAARCLARPVRWQEDRREHMSAAPQGRGLHATARAAVAADGTVLAIDAELFVDQGAYVGPHGLATADLCAALVPGPYRVPAYRATAHVRTTNRTPAGPLRGTGAAEAAFLRERLMDAIAADLAIDPLELRRRNFVDAAHMPADRHLETLGVPLALDSGRYQHLVDQAVKRWSVDLLRRRCEDRRAQGERAGLGMGFAIDPGGISPATHARIAVDRRGTVELEVAAAPAGEGLDTALAQIVADIVGVDPAAVRVLHDRTDRIVHGGGDGGLPAVGTAAQLAAEALREKILLGAAARLGVPAERLTVHAGRVREADRHFGGTLALGDLARALEPGTVFAGPDGTGLTAEAWSRHDAFAVPYALAIVLVDIDADTGLVRVPRALLAADVGNAIHPQMVEERLAGGLLQGIAGALWTELPVMAAGMPRTQGLADYAMPSSAEAPAVEVFVTEDAPSPHNPLGLKDVDSLGVLGAGAAVAAAIDNAVGAPGFAATLPITPARIRAHLREAARMSARVPQPVEA